MWKCINCAEQIEDDFETCWNCGFDKDGTPPTPLQRSSQDEETVASFDPLMQTLPPSASGIPAQTSGEKIQLPKDEVIRKQFNWGAFALTFIWLLFHRRAGTSLILVVLLNLFFGFAFGSSRGAGFFLTYALIVYPIRLYFGFVADEIAWETNRYTSFQQLKQKQKGWILAGKIVFFFVEIPLSIYILFF